MAFLLMLGCTGQPKGHAATIPHPDAPGKVVEYFSETPKTSGPWPVVVFLHGHQDGLVRPGGKTYADWGVLDEFAKRGYLAVSISLPGYGGSSGPEDFAGPFTQHAVEAVLAKVRQDPRVAPDRVAIEGVSLGAVTGALVAEHDPNVRGLVLISGLYDLQPFFAHPKSDAAKNVRSAFDSQTGGTPEALQTRSALRGAATIRAHTLIINGARDDRTDPDQARQLAAAINAHGGHAWAHIYPDYGHEIPVKVRALEIDAFLDETLMPDSGSAH
ncbi:alpha/beta hydrolase family protein [Asticcacaulis sp. AC460]|uniref:alpha/beta hydrolase family protein n=1 Tax=Asticcacaulis sp. AC460 TaxID=1282360 RepID=UPI00138AC3FA|nr:alpha/beta fold hydrolase [Asticcacaulis sp. AC460]